MILLLLFSKIKGKDAWKLLDESLFPGWLPFDFVAGELSNWSIPSIHISSVVSVGPTIIVGIGLLALFDWILLCLEDLRSVPSSGNNVDSLKFEIMCDWIYT